MPKKSTNFIVTNQDSVKKALSGLSDSLKNKILKKVINKGLSPIVKQMKSEIAPVKKSGLLRKSITKKVRTYSSGITWGAAGPDKQTIGTYQNKKRWPLKYAHLVNYGTQAHSLNRRNAQHPGSQGLNYLSKAWNKTKAFVESMILKDIEEELFKEASKK